MLFIMIMPLHWITESKESDYSAHGCDYNHIDPIDFDGVSYFLDWSVALLRLHYISLIVGHCIYLM